MIVSCPMCGESWEKNKPMFDHELKSIKLYLRCIQCHEAPKKKQEEKSKLPLSKVKELMGKAFDAGQGSKPDTKLDSIKIILFTEGY